MLPYVLIALGIVLGDNTILAAQVQVCDPDSFCIAYDDRVLTNCT
jgi:hypothetical protein